MNGRALPEDHGFPVRVLTPGWIGIANIKWVGTIEVSETPLFSQWNTTLYRFFGEAYPDSPVLYDQQPKSALEIPWPATLPAGKQGLTGRSWSPFDRIKHVEVSFDGGSRWKKAKLEKTNTAGTRLQWSIKWDPSPGSYGIRVRAEDKAGTIQPDSVPFNEQGYLYWAVVDHPVTARCRELGAHPAKARRARRWLIRARRESLRA